MKRILVTGGAGFIGSNFVHYCLSRHAEDRVVVLDRLTYAGSVDNLASAAGHSNFRFVKGDICDDETVRSLMLEERIDSIVHCAAETHVDRSISGSDAFIRTNVEGTHVLLKTARELWLESGPAPKAPKFLHVSTDEVFGDLGPDDPPFREDTPYAPSSPYSASKAASDHLVRAWHRTYGLPVVITNCSNNYGPYQFPEKLIPLVIQNAMLGKRLPVYGDGSNVRDWLYVEDHVHALRKVLDEGEIGRSYNIGGGSQRANLEVVQAICRLLDRCAARPGMRYEELIEFVADRPGHDRRYAIDDSRIRDELGWKPRISFEQGLSFTVRWYLKRLEAQHGATHGVRRRGLVDRGGS